MQASAHFDRALYDGGEFGTSAEEDDYLGLPGLLDPEQVGLLLRKRQADRLREGVNSAKRGTHAAASLAAGAAGRRGPAAAAGAAAAGAPGPAAAAAPATRETLAALRKELNLLITAWHHRTGQPHGVIHADLRRACGGPSLPEATGQQIRARIETIRRWASAAARRGRQRPRVRARR